MDIHEHVEESEEAYRNGDGIVVEGDEPEVQENGIEFERSEQYYQVGGASFECPVCGDEIESECYQYQIGGEWLNDETTEIAYCDECDIQYERPREQLFSHVSVQEQIEDDEIDEADSFLFSVSTETLLEIAKEDRIHNTRYGCPYCSWEHYYTKPAGDWEKSHDNTIHSYDAIWINCECGNSLDWHGDHTCEECGRTFELSASQPDDS